MKNKAYWLLLCLTLSWGWAVQANTMVQPVEHLQQALLQAMQQPSFTQRYQQLQPVVEQAFALSVIARIAVGRYWQNMTPEQQRQYVALFTRLSVATYAKRFRGYQNEYFSLENHQAQGGRGQVRAILHHGDEQTRFTYQLRQLDNQWRIVNVSFNGISDLALRRAQYTSVLKQSGIRALLAKLQQQYQDLLTSNPQESS